MRFISLSLPLLLSVPAFAQQADVSPQARQLHESMLVLDTHLDIPARFEPGWDFGERHIYDWDESQTDLPRMIEGGLDGGHFVIYIAQGDLTPAGYADARDQALTRAAAIHRIIGENDLLQLATTADDAERLHREGKRIAYISMENSWPLGEDLSLLETFHKLGVRMAGPVHSRNNQFADSTTDEPRWNGLSPLGRQWVADMNRLGMLIDGSHSSDATFDQLVELSRVPIVLSHSGPRALYDHPRNLDDARMRRLAETGGVMFINSVFLTDGDDSDERNELRERQRNWQNLSEAERRQVLADKAVLDARRPYTDATIDSFMRSLLHSVRVMGVDHVGLGADWDGGGGVVGMEDIANLPVITQRLKQEGFSDADIAKIMGGNLLRVMRQAEVYAAAQ